VAFYVLDTPVMNNLARCYPQPHRLIRNFVPVIKHFPLPDKAILYNRPPETFISDNFKAKDITLHEFI